MSTVNYADIVGDRLPRASLVIFVLLMFIGGLAFAFPKSVVIDERSTLRNVCQLEFAPVKGLVVEAKLPPAGISGARVNNERYEACPYDIEVKFGGTKMRIDFGIRFDLNAVKNYSPAIPVDAGFFVYDGQAWRTQSDAVADVSEPISVTETEHALLVRGLLRRRDPGSHVEDYCYALAVVYESGFAVGGVCATTRESLRPWAQLFGVGSAVRYVGSH